MPARAQSHAGCAGILQTIADQAFGGGKQKTGHSPIDYFIQMKMQKASQQLDFTNRSVKDIAMSIGGR